MSKSEKSITQELLRTLLEYDPQTGIFRWKIKASSSAHPGDIAGCIDGQGYRVIRIYGKNRKAHRLAWLYVYGDEPEVIDHIDRNRSNNAIENLRAVTFSQNSANRAAKSKNKSGFTGVYWNELGKKWQASIVANGRTHYVGLFATAQEAAKARTEYARQLYANFYIPSFHDQEAAK
ncbi:HNH endonuclease [Klebsiella pneumoniae]|uniref:HNH endonuclease n=13 Tax=Klebsiella pneumoniae TaxID=573 RepID=A0A2U0L1P5_KLEPN|nr:MULTISPECIES: HNH endonuclease signature motif containing protein [Klebsiella]AHM86581.1 Endonuclease [Klebsiella pneumoniae 30660/NJST258_1]AKS01613.1 Fis family transcriptional regulator [Klebsiella pneumoniae UHKPC33]EJK27762.1 Pathogenesis-related transcriptional factor and ERF protein [Klebsiella pneumoniae subsp. pneumoniae KPNIH19]ENY54734.1 Pathogenesis-related transcriptional factor and ERF protein [Klebsiella pneumoniae subsp. pneumoniae KpMDU1]QBQ71436.1 HNH endonuclease [Klebsie